MKYIAHTLAGYEQPVIFCDAVDHIAMVDAIGAKGALVSAGFVTVIDGRVSCFGSSMTLNLSARRVEDAALITRMLVDAD